MRFTVTGEWTRNRLLMLIVGFFLVFASLLWVTNTLLYFHAMDLTPSGVVAHYLGDEASFRPPRSYRSLLEVSHFHLFAVGIELLTLTHLLLFVPVSMRLRAGLTIASFMAALGDEAAGWLVRYAHPGFAYLKIASFLTLQATMAAMIGLIAWAMATKAPSAYRDGEGAPPSKPAAPAGCPVSHGGGDDEGEASRPRDEGAEATP